MYLHEEHHLTLAASGRPITCRMIRGMDQKPHPSHLTAKRQGQTATRLDIWYVLVKDCCISCDATALTWRVVRHRRTIIELNLDTALMLVVRQRMTSASTPRPHFERIAPSRSPHHPQIVHVECEDDPSVTSIANTNLLSLGKFFCRLSHNFCTSSLALVACSCPPIKPMR